MTDTTEPLGAETAAAPDQQPPADTKPAPARASARKAPKGASTPVVDLEVAFKAEPEAPICEICMPRGWPDGAMAVGCEHGHWTR
ncbi:hypothetical protein [Streptomyces sp. NRRL S-350]|uniref:hypothetical protein n=1 Tax=Streptomyces sp. NRRL S-350 TaxID=1463902 RepID=UPI0004C277D8|nr:hypothetical protein [Streptomyces sp. NRRL S-350]